MKRITAKEFRELGLLQEINRLFLHPMGLALETVVEADGSESFGQVWDKRADPLGILFAEGVIDTQKSKAAEELYAAKKLARERAFGWHIQPQ